MKHNKLLACSIAALLSSSALVASNEISAAQIEIFYNISAAVHQCVNEKYLELTQEQKKIVHRDPFDFNQDTIEPQITKMQNVLADCQSRDPSPAPTTPNLDVAPTTTPKRLGTPTRDQINDYIDLAGKVEQDIDVNLLENQKGLVAEIERLKKLQSAPQEMKVIYTDFDNEDEWAALAMADAKRSESPDEKKRAIKKVHEIPGSAKLLIGAIPDAYSSIERFPIERYPNMVFLDSGEYITVSDRSENVPYVKKKRAYLPVDFSRPFLVYSANDSSQLNELAVLFPGKFSEIIFDGSVTKFLTWDRNHLNAIYKLLQDGGKLYISHYKSFKQKNIEPEILSSSFGVFEIKNNVKYPIEGRYIGGVYLVATKDG